MIRLAEIIILPSTNFELGVLGEIPLDKYNLYLQPGLFYSAKGNQYERAFDSAVYKN